MDDMNLQLRSVWLAIIVIGGLLAAAAAGVAFRAVGADMPGALGAASATFVGAITLGLAARRFLTG